MSAPKLTKVVLIAPDGFVCTHCSRDVQSAWPKPVYMWVCQCGWCQHRDTAHPEWEAVRAWMNHASECPMMRRKDD